MVPYCHSHLFTHDANGRSNLSPWGPHTRTNYQPNTFSYQRSNASANDCETKRYPNFCPLRTADSAADESNGTTHASTFKSAVMQALGAADAAAELSANKSADRETLEATTRNADKQAFRPTHKSAQ